MAPLEVTKYDRTTEELQYFLIYCLIVAGKNSDWASRTVGRLFRCKPDEVLPFDYLREYPQGLHNALVANRVGQYRRITLAIEQSYDVDLNTCTVADLEAIHGVGPKTARFFILHSRRGASCAVIDTHVLKYLREKDTDAKIPDATPHSRKVYEFCEGLFLTFIKADFPHLTVAAADLLVWAKYSGRLDNDIQFAEDAVFSSRTG